VSAESFFERWYVKWAIVLTVGVTLAFISYQRITDPQPRLERAKEESVVLEARVVLHSYVMPVGALELVDALAKDHKVGDSYVWPNEAGFEVSGFYRRDSGDHWHPFLMQLDQDSELISLSVGDGNERLLGLSSQDPQFLARP
jgi:hypothetical protein